MDDSETRVTVMITVIAGAAAVRSTTAMADARDMARAFLEGLQQPAVRSPFTIPAGTCRACAPLT
ncbi:hypothetical protein ACIP4U_26945 [Streptomyces caelestis]|uniref:hypothetical protein n=1 Tax=Streptomyces caelestis TaxID=36816 RepID=UPI00380E6BA6